MKTCRILLASVATIMTAAPALTEVIARDQFTMHADSFAFERGSMNPILKDAHGDWYLVVQLSEAGQPGIPGTACTNPTSQVDTNLPCWLKWNSATKNWEEHAQPTIPSHPCAEGTSTCNWYVDTDSRGGWVIAAYVDKVGRDIYLLSLSQTSGGINFTDAQVATALLPNESGSVDQFAAVALDDVGCAYVLSVVDDGTADRPTMHHIDLAKPGGRTSVETPGGRHVLSLAPNEDVANDDGGDVAVTTKLDGTPRAVAIYSDQNQDYLFRRDHAVLQQAVAPDYACAGGWFGHQKINETAFDVLSSPPNGTANDRVDGHIAMAADPANSMWYAIVKTSVDDDDGDPAGDRPILVLVRGVGDSCPDSCPAPANVDEDIYEIVDMNETPPMPIGGGASRPSLWLNPGYSPGLMIAYHDADAPRNTVLTRIPFIPPIDSDSLAELIEWEDGYKPAHPTNPGFVSKNLWPRLVFSQCEDETPGFADCAANQQINGGSHAGTNGWKGAAWSSVRTGGTTNFLMAVDERVVPTDPSNDNEVLTAEIGWTDWGCDDHYDNDGDGAGDNTPPITDNRDALDTACGGANQPEDAACSDTIDNDGDGKIDRNGFGGKPADPDCASDSDNKEQPSGCGLGFEAAVALIAIAGARRRFRGPVFRAARAGRHRAF